jgi:hypothetical protein
MAQSDDLIRAAAASARFDEPAETADYLARGRAHQWLSTDALKASWKASWILALRTGHQSRSEENRLAIRDFEAELGLRSEEPPYDGPEVCEEIRKTGSVDFREHLRAFQERDDQNQIN